MNWFRHTLKKLLCTFTLLLLPLLAFSQERPLLVGISNHPPFDIIEDGQYTGIAITIWERVAQMNHWSFQYVLLDDDDTDAALQQVRDGSLDVLVGPISVTHNRLQYVDFSRAFFLEKMALTTLPAHNYSMVFHEFLSTALLYIAGISICFFILYVHLLWYFERGKTEGIPTDYKVGISTLIWDHLLKHNVSLPSTIYGRLILFVWLITTAIFFTSYNASITSALTLALTSDKKVVSFSNLRGMRITGFAGSTSGHLAQVQGTPITFVKSIGEAFKLLSEDKTDGVLSSLSIADYYLRNHPSKQKYTVDVIHNQVFESAFALRVNSPLKRAVDLGITQLQDDHETTKICEQYMDEDNAKRCNF